MEVLREDKETAFLAGTAGVSILVLMEVLREALWAPPEAYHEDLVSILVLMEVLREERVRNVSKRLSPCGFNPCFDGSVERGRVLTPRSRPHSMFQSLF